MGTLNQPKKNQAHRFVPQMLIRASSPRYSPKLVENAARSRATNVVDSWISRRWTQVAEGFNQRGRLRHDDPGNRLPTQVPVPSPSA